MKDNPQMTEEIESVLREKLLSAPVKAAPEKEEEAEEPEAG